LLAGSVYLCFAKKNDLIRIDYSEIGVAEVRSDRADMDWGWFTSPDLPWRFDDALSFDDLKNHADLIVSVKAIDSRGKNNCALTRVEAISVFQGEGIAAGDEIEVYEWGELFQERVYLARSGYVLMRPEREYILFLDEFDDPYYGEEAYLLTNVFYGKIPVDRNDAWDIVSTETVKTMTYAQIQDFGVLTDDSAVVEHYREISESALRFSDTEA
jgi:hypothetical protein